MAYGNILTQLGVPPALSSPGRQFFVLHGGKRERTEKRKKAQGRRQNKKEPRVSPLPPSVPSVVPVLPPAKPFRIYLMSWLSHRSPSLAVREGFAMFGIDQNGKTFVAARIVASWRRREGKRRGGRISRREFFGVGLAVVSLGEKTNINPSF